MRVVIAALCAVLMMGVGAWPAAAQRIEILPHYRDILPNDFTPAPAALPPGALRDAKVVLIPSANFNAYSAWWSEAYAPERRASSFQRLVGINDEVNRVGQNPSDPRNFPDAIVGALKEAVREVGVADDIAGAHAAGADFVVVIDFWQRFRGMNLHSAAGVYILDRQLNEVSSITNTSRVGMRDGGGGLFCGAACVTRLSALTFEDGYAAVTAPVFARLRSTLQRQAQP